jgi:hypothetical protein
MAGRTYLKANFKKILAIEDPMVGSLMLPFLDIWDFMNGVILKFYTAVF